MATLETMLNDPKLSARDRLAVIDQIMKRYYPEPKVDSAAGACGISVMLTAVQTDVSVLVNRAQRRIAAQPVEMIEVELDPEAPTDRCISAHRKRLAPSHEHHAVRVLE